MEAMGAERIWLYLHDNKSIVQNRTYIGNTYLYLNGLLELLFWADPIALSEVKQRIKIEKMTEETFSGKFFLDMREGYGLTEYRLIKLHRGSKTGKNLEKYFPELLKNEKDIEDILEIPLIDLERLKNDIEYRYMILREFEVDDEIGKEMTDLVNSGNVVATNLLLYGAEYLEEDEKKEKTPKR